MLRNTPAGLLRTLSTVRFENRRGERRPAIELLTLKTDLCVTRAEMQNLSSHGALLKIAEGYVPNSSDKVTLQFVDGRYLWGIIVWTQNEYLGVSLGHPLDDIGHFLNAEGRGDNYFRQLLRGGRHGG